MIPYKTSRDMHHLKELLDKGYEVVCFYTHDAFGLKENSHTPYMVTDVCTARYIEDDEFSKYIFGCRGSVFIEYWTNNFPYKYTFEELLAARDIQFIEPTILNEKDILDLTSKKKRKDIKHEHCGNCRYFMSGECLNPKMIKGATEEGWEYLQVDANEDACGEFIKGRRKNPRTQFELKAIKQGDSLTIDDTKYTLHIEKKEECMTRKELKQLNMKSTKDHTIWVVRYTDHEHNTVLSVHNTQFQAAIDTTLSELKKMKLTE